MPNLKSLGEPIDSPCEGGHCTSLKEEVTGMPHSRCEKHTPKVSNLKQTVREELREKFGEQVAPSGIYAVQTNIEDLYPFLDSIIDRAKKEVVEEMVKIIRESRTLDENLGIGMREGNARFQAIADILSKQLTN